MEKDERVVYDSGARIRIAMLGTTATIHIDGEAVDLSLDDLERLHMAIGEAFAELRKPRPQDPRD